MFQIMSINISVISSIYQRLVVQHNLLPWFKRWHPHVGTAGTSESITKVTLPKEIKNLSSPCFFTARKCTKNDQMSKAENEKILTLPQADFGRLVFCFPLLSCSNSSARPHELNKHADSIMSTNLNVE